MHGVLRTCVIGREKRPKEEMLRLVVDAEGEIWPDVWAKAPGRGAYHCLRPECLRRSAKRLAAMRAKFPSVRADWPRLRARILASLDQAIALRMRQARPKAAIGKDAASRRLGYNQNLVVVVAKDAGEALQRWLDAALAWRKAEGYRTELVSGCTKRELGAWLGREAVAVVAFPAQIAAPLARWLQWRAWLLEALEKGET
ncbi:MAG: YlxR family protein [Zetaproteobacteria bacterium]|nr:MAG: YlxR family protein [Zetaproteobacteria bacterium]